MSWISISLEPDAERADALSEALLAAGAMAVDIGDAAAGTAGERAVFGDVTPAASPWDRVVLRALFPPDIDVAAVLAAATHASGMEEKLSYRVDRLDDRDWVRASQAQFAPLQICERLWIVPSWHVPPDTDAINIVVDPGLAFGTGSHPSTRLCLRWLYAMIRGGESVVDFGCGSGILAIAALKLGAASACGVDIDEQALLAARNNAVQNQVNARFVNAASELNERAGVVVANILSNPLRVLAPLLAGLTDRGGRIALAGVLEDQAEEVCAAYRPWYEIAVTAGEEGWVLLSGVKT